MNHAGARFVTVARYGTPVEAELAQGLLDAEGVEAFVRDHLTVGVAPHLTGVIGGIRLDVYADDAERATGILEQNADHFEADEPEVYRVTRNRALESGLVVGGAAILVAVALGIGAQHPLLSAMMVLLSAIAGIAWGSRLSRVQCSNMSCNHLLSAELVECPRLAQDDCG